MNNFEKNQYPGQAPILKTNEEMEQPIQPKYKKEETVQQGSTPEAPQIAENKLEDDDFIPHYLLESIAE